MPRNYSADDRHVYRAVIVTRTGDQERTERFGPYALPAAARARVTLAERDAEHYNSYARLRGYPERTVEGRVERAADLTWERV